MNTAARSTAVVILILLAAPLASADTPSPPHRVYGYITDGSATVTDTAVSFRHDGTTLVSGTTDGDGYYDLNVPYQQSYTGEQVSLYVDGADTGKDITFTSGASEQLDHDGDYIQDGGGGGGNAAPTADAGDGYSVAPGATLQLDGSGSSDPDGDTLSFEWSIQEPAQTWATLEDADTATPLFNASNVTATGSVDVELVVTDTGSETASDVVSVTIEQAQDDTDGGGDTGGGDTGGGGFGPPQDDTVRQTATPSNGRASVTIDRVEQGQRVAVEISNPSEGSPPSVSAVSFTAREAGSNVEVSVSEVSERPADVTDAGDAVYSYQEITASGMEDAADNATISFRVSRQWLANRSAGPADVGMRRFVDGDWQDLPTRPNGSTDTHHRFVAESPGFSYFAIAVSGTNETDTGTGGDQPRNGTDADDTDQPTEDPGQQDRSGTPVLPAVIVVALLAAAAWYYRDELRDRFMDAAPASTVDDGDADDDSDESAAEPGDTSDTGPGAA